MEQTFNLPPIGDLKKLTEDQLKPIFFELEQHHARQLAEASCEYLARVNRVTKDYATCFNTLSDILAKTRKQVS